jgi:hypothetical protein
MNILSKFSAILSLFLSFNCDILIAQTIMATDQDAIDYFKLHPPKYNFEGVYEYYKDFKVNKLTNPDLSTEYSGYSDKNEKICIYFDGAKIIAKTIGGDLFFNDRDGMNEFIVDGFGVLRFCYSYKSDQYFSFDIDNQKMTSTVHIQDGDLFFETPSPIMTMGTMRQQFEQKYMLKKIYNPNIAAVSSPKIASGTGFALTSNGLIATNNHVIDGGKKITVKGINGDFSKSYIAKIIIVDKNNDLAIIQIDDPSFKILTTIPYVISSKTVDAGSSVFVLGYPLRASMGDEIKLTNGIISSKSGYQGDITTYQISVPVQPGNSGGAMYDIKGNVVGIVNAKLVGAENASYAIKTPYLINLIETLPTVPKLQTVSSLANKPLTEQVKIIKKYTYIIEAQ